MGPEGFLVGFFEGFLVGLLEGFLEGFLVGFLVGFGKTEIAEVQDPPLLEPAFTN